MLNNYDFIKVGKAVCPKYEKVICYIIEILGETIITTNGTYKKEELQSLVTVYNNYLWAENILENILKSKGGKAL